MIVAIDYDKTYTVDPVLFDQIIKLFQSNGHTVVCITLRPPIMGEEVLNSIGKLVAVLFTSGKMKREYAEENGISVDIWVDDMPEMISNPLKIFKV